MPLRIEFVKEKQGGSAYQVKSGYSIVIFCPKKERVYKHCLERGTSEI